MFSPLCPHNKLLAEGHKIVSAGIFKMYSTGIQIIDHGSVSLGIKANDAREQADYMLLKSRLFSSMD